MTRDEILQLPVFSFDYEVTTGRDGRTIKIPRMPAVLVRYAPEDEPIHVFDSDGVAWSVVATLSGLFRQRV